MKFGVNLSAPTGRQSPGSSVSPGLPPIMGQNDQRSPIMNPALLLRALIVGVAAMLTVLPPAAAQTTLDKVSFGTNWVAEAEHGGFFQSVADGTYKNYGLDVTIVPGGPNENNRMLLIAGKLDFFMSANSLQSFDAVANNVPLVAVGAMFQKDPQVLLYHPETKVTKLEDLKSLTLFVSKEGVTTYFRWLKSEYGFSESKVKPYTFNPQPFIVNKQSAMQGYVTSEPYAVEKDREGVVEHREKEGTKVEDLKSLTLFVSKEGVTTYFRWLKSEYGFSESKVKPYTFNPQPFIVNKQSAMQGYVTSEPYAVE